MLIKKQRIRCFIVVIVKQQKDIKAKLQYSVLRVDVFLEINKNKELNMKYTNNNCSQDIGADPYYGVELECVFKNGYADENKETIYSIIDSKGYCQQLIKTIDFGDDCSLNASGIEFRFPPMSYDELMYWHEVAEFLRAVELCGAKAWTSRCNGIHIHINRGCLTKLHQYKIIQFFHNCKDILKNASRRRSFEYCSLDYLPQAIDVPFQEYGCREAIGVQNKTLEIRIFQSTTNILAFRAYVQFTEALRLFTQSTSIRNLNEHMFREFINKHKFLLADKLISTNNKFPPNKELPCFKAEG